MSLIMGVKGKLNASGLCSTTYMPKSVTEFLRESAASLRDLALRAPEIANELRRFADELEQEAERATRVGRSQKQDDAAE